MAFSAHKDEESIKEHFDPPEILAKKVDKLVALIHKSKHFVIFTGAGISTDAGIPDFRGPEGVWTLKAQGRHRTGPTTDTLCAIPTATHMSIVELQNRGILRYVISQNCDGLHRRSGIRPERISELHGNGNIEYCELCGFEYLRDYDTDRVQRGSHWTGRYCVIPNCGGKLMDSTIDFGQNLPERPLRRAEKHSKKSDLHMVLGSSLTVRPACNMPKRTAKMGGKLVIVNLQKTPLDNLACLRIFHRCDVVMKEVMKRLAIPIPPFKLVRRFAIRHQYTERQWHVDIRGIDYGTGGTEIPASTLKKVEITLPSLVSKKHMLLKKEPFVVSLERPSKRNPLGKGKVSAKLRLHMMGHYAEPPLDINLHESDPPHVVHIFSFDPITGEWENLKDAMVEEGGEKEKELDAGEKEKEKGGDGAHEMDIDENRVRIKVSELSTTGKPPNPGLWGAAVLGMGPKKKGVLVSIGGSNTNPAYSAISVLDLKTLKWTSVQKGNDDMPYISKGRWGHTATVVYRANPSLVFLIGGWDSSSQYNDTYVFDCRTHNIRKIRPAKGSVSPSYRAGHSATAYEQSIIIFGGACCKAGPYTFYNDVYVLDIETDKWKEWKCTGDLPSPRAQHSAILTGEQLIILGGYDGKKVLNDVYSLDLNTLEWRRVETHGTPPPEIEDASEANYRVYPARHTAVPLIPTGGDTMYLVCIGHAGVHLLNVANWTWTRPKLVAARSPQSGEKEEDGCADEDEELVLPASLTCHSAVDITASTVVTIGGICGDDEVNQLFSLES